MDKEILVFCDESVKDGPFYSDFYGGLIVGSSNYERITKNLDNQKVSLNLFGEVKWCKVTEAYLEKYKKIMDMLFEEIKAKNLRIRVMFRQNALIKRGALPKDYGDRYFKLYYQFIKHGLGVNDRPLGEPHQRIRLFFDRIPDTKERIAQFKGFLSGLNHGAFKKVNMSLDMQDIAEINSHDHVLLQCLDIVLGSMAFRLNDMHLAKPKGQHFRGKKTRAKERLYKHILSHVQGIKKNFNIGISTGGESADRWERPYGHFRFVPNGSVMDTSMTKKGGKK